MCPNDANVQVGARIPPDHQAPNRRRCPARIMYLGFSIRLPSCDVFSPPRQRRSENIGTGVIAMETNFSSWNTHVWTTRRLELAPGQPLTQQVCRECGRAFVDECSTGKRYAVHVSIFKFHRLCDEVTSRWLAEKCPAERLMADEADRKTRFMAGSPRSAVGEMANDGLDLGSSPNQNIGSKVRRRRSTGPRGTRRFGGENAASDQFS
jgi:hypothetical protein